MPDLGKGLSELRRKSSHSRDEILALGNSLGFLSSTGLVDLFGWLIFLFCFLLTYESPKALWCYQ